MNNSYIMRVCFLIWRRSCFIVVLCQFIVFYSLGRDGGANLIVTVPCSEEMMSGVKIQICGKIWSFWTNPHLLLLLIFQTTLTEVQFGPMKLFKDPLQVRWDKAKLMFEELCVRIIQELLAAERGVTVNIWEHLSRISVSKRRRHCLPLLFAVRTNLEFLRYHTSPRD